MNITGKQATNNLMWRLMERVGAQGVSFLVTILLARLLDPKVYGTIALVTVFITILQVFVDSGLASALVQKKDADDIDFSTVFFFNIVFCVFLYGVLFCSAPLIAHFYNIPSLTDLVRVLGITLIISGIKNTQQAYVTKHLMFKRFFWSTLGGTIGAAIIGIWMAYKGYGVWALVVQNLFNQTVDTIILWITVRWRPIRAFSWKRLKGLLSFGWKMLAARLLNTFYNEFRSLIIGKRYTTEDLAFYNRGQQLPELIVLNIDVSVQSVLFSIMSAEQDNKDRVKAIVKRTIQINSYIICPLMMGLAVCAEPLIRVILTEKWIPCLPYLRMFCFTYAFVVFNTANMNSYRSIGRSDIYLKVELTRKLVELSALLVTMWISVYAMALSVVVTSVIAMFINTYPNSRLIHYGFFSQLKDMLPAIILTSIMGVCVYCVSYLNLSDIATVIIQALVGIVVYLGLSIIFKPEAFKYLITIIKSYINK